MEIAVVRTKRKNPFEIAFPNYIVHFWITGGIVFKNYWGTTLYLILAGTAF
jgi:hypothetical protein